MLKVLIVEDEETTRDVLKDYLPWSDIGVDFVSEASNGLLALDVALSEKPDIIICDVRMPYMNGIEFATRIIEIKPDCKIIFLSAYSDKEYLKSAIRLKAECYIEKPVNLDEITQVLKLTVAECRKEKNEHLQNIASMRQALCQSLSTRNVDLDNILLQIKRLNLDFSVTNSYLSCLIRIFPVELENLEVCLSYVFSRLLIALEPHSNCYISTMKSDGTILCHFKIGEGLDLGILKSELYKLIEISKTYTDHIYRIFIAMGSAVDGLQNVSKSYQDAVITLKKQFFYGYNKISIYSNDVSAPFELDESLIKKFSEQLKLHEKNEALLLIKRLVNSIRNHVNTPISSAREVFFKLALAISTYSEKMNIPFNPQSLLNKLTIAITIYDLEELMLNTLNNIFISIESQNIHQNLVSKTTILIQENYTNPDLSIEMIAEKLFITPNYISALYKSSTGKTISQYITDVRIDKAMELLKNTDRKLYDIGRSVGYNNGKYFCRVFEKAVGIRAKDYRGLRND